MAKAGTELQRLFRFRQKKRYAVHPRLILWAVGGILLVTLSFLSIPRGTLPTKRLKLGDIVPRDIKAPTDMLVEDIESTRKIREKASEAVKEVFDLDLQLSDTIRKRLHDELTNVRKEFLKHDMITGKKEKLNDIRDKNGGFLPRRKDSKLNKRQKYKLFESDFYDKIQLRPSPLLTEYLRLKSYSPEIARSVGFLLAVSMENGVVSDKKILDPHANKGIFIQVLGKEGLKEQRDIAGLLDLNKASGVIEKLAPLSDMADSDTERLAITELASKLLEPNLTVNKRATKNLRAKALKIADPVFFQIKKGEMIAREGDRLIAHQVAKLRALEAREEKRGFLGSLFGMGILISLALALVSIYLLRFKIKITESPRRVILLGVILLGTMLLVQGSMQMGLAFTETIGNVQARSYFHAIPFATGAMLAAILLDFEIAIVVTALTAFLSGLVLPQAFSFSLITLIGGLVTSFRIRSHRRRSSILLTALLVGLANATIIVALHMIEGQLFSSEGWFTVIMGLVGGLLTGIVVSAVLPILESLFKIASDIKLLELSDLNHPLMRQLVMNSPGTYHHSVVVSNLSEEAAEMIGANTLLVRVAAYYHDIGKIRKSNYFIENQSITENLHDQLTPRMSALILISHVKEGIELARKYNLPEQLIDFIPQHHGTSLISYFYNKAKELEDPDQQDVDEADFRYSGPKPQSREAGILMLADAVEAASRSLRDPNPARVQNMVRNNVSRVFAEGQLDDCELTLRGLNLISAAFIRILTGRFHHRVDYPEIDQARHVELEAKLDASRVNEQTNYDKDRSQMAWKPSSEAVKASESSLG